MIHYNPREWFRALFTIHKADTFRALFPMLIFFILYSWLIVYLETEYFKLAETSSARNLTIMHTLLGFAISMLLVFRTNTAYDRWWEGRRLWGALMNNSVNLAIKMKSYIPSGKVDDILFFKEYLPLYSHVLMNHLSHKEFPVDSLFTNEDAMLESATHKPHYVAQKMMHRTHVMYKEGVLTGDQLIVMNEELRSFTDICGGCERIKNTPIPFSYSVFIKKFIFIYVGTLPFGFAFSLGFFTIPVTTFIFYVLASLELIAEEIEDPFGGDNNDLPMRQITGNIKKRVNEIFDRKLE
jgi:putative membrane protein